VQEAPLASLNWRGIAALLRRMHAADGA